MQRSAFVLIAGLLASASAQFNPFNCRSLTNTMTNFDPVQFQGDWYQQATTFDITKLDTKCVSTNVTTLDNSTILFHTIGEGLFNIPYQDYVATSQDGNPSSGKFTVQRKFLGLLDLSFPLIILDTDYTSFALLWSCSGLLGINFEYSWIWTRARTPDATLKILENAKAQATRFQIDPNTYFLTQQYGCFTYG